MAFTAGATRPLDEIALDAPLRLRSRGRRLRLGRARRPLPSVIVGRPSVAPVFAPGVAEHPDPESCPRYDRA